MSLYDTIIQTNSNRRIAEIRQSKALWCGVHYVVYIFFLFRPLYTIFYGELNDTKKEELSHSMPLYTYYTTQEDFALFKGKKEKIGILFLYQHNRQYQVKAKDMRPFRYILIAFLLFILLLIIMLCIGIRCCPVFLLFFIIDVL